MKISRDEVLHIAKLAEIEIPPGELERVTEDLCRICDYVDLLNEVSTPAEGQPFLAGPGRAALREDVIDPVALAHPVEELAPEFVAGFFLVPKLDGMEEG
ncbi:MAG: Asp-tRNA(Asn)/Glu-tRNA(Gln) amidotransferase subunit GatC [Gemmatimonadales bacterium]|nr:Asp-tRNA(Asn)/Glu-tRNA(Gln) amidotransferase subunit GatC [Gemmatimonadales bacterium]